MSPLWFGSVVASTAIVGSGGAVEVWGAEASGAGPPVSVPPVSGPPVSGLSASIRGGSVGTRSLAGGDAFVEAESLLPSNS
jgi:hypothetical protein